MELYNDILNETIICDRLQNGLNYYIIPKSMYNEKRALLTVKYGSVDNVFNTGGKAFETPLGVAHFLEHKLFDNERGSAFESFSRLGAFANAYTSFNNTAYYFSCNGNFEKNLETLLGFVSEPYFTDESVEKEMGIIGQEISMYDDNPAWNVYFDMLSCLYESHPAGNNIAGNYESIRLINADMLYKCYDSFYVPANMHLICVGGFDEGEKRAIAEIGERYWEKGAKRAETVLPAERTDVKTKENVRRIAVSRPAFQIGFKDRCFDDQIKKSCIQKVTLDLLIGESSELKESLVNERLADDTLSFDYICGDSYGYSVISGESRAPEDLLESCIKRASEISASGFNEKDFLRIKKKHLGRFARGFNSVEAIAAASAEYAMKGANLFDCFEDYSEIKIEDCDTLLSETFREGGIAVAVLEPEG